MPNFWRDRNVLVTGANGFVGSMLAASLAGQQANVVAAVRDIRPKSTLAYMGVEKKLHGIAKGDLADFSFVARVMDEYEISHCFHVAAQPIVGIANHSPLQTFETNIKGTWNVLEACRNCKTFAGLVVASSDKAYGSNPNLPYQEDYPLNATNPYDVSKACTEAVSKAYFSTYGLPLAITRCSNIYGPGDLNFSRIVPGTVKTLIFGEQPIVRSDGTPVRDFIYIDDTVSAYLALAENLQRKDVNGQALNFGGGGPIRIIDAVEKIIKLSGKKLKPKVVGTGKLKGEIDAQYLSNEKASKLLGWAPKTKLEDGLLKAYGWYETYFRDGGYI
ncbi:MAG: GDP-mannose 4,6-dehydratase [Candidatus Aenigmarchaeota archaeon]|nr:GDP-mannose 4,6-dehydratase [Candidatus Aenigmarchaeota archaeon]